jgi:hypothetical protein
VPIQETLEQVVAGKMKMMKKEEQHNAHSSKNGSAIDDFMLVTQRFHFRWEFAA